MRMNKITIYLMVLFFVSIKLKMLGSDVWLVASVAAVISMFFVCVKEFNTNVFFAFFLLSFFIFLMSGDIAELLFNEQYYLRFSDETNIHAHKCIFISLAAMFIGYVLTPVGFDDHIANKKIKNVDLTQVKSISKLVYIFSYIFLLINTLDAVRFVSSHGYVAYYVSFRSILPLLLVKIGELAPLALCIYLSTFPTKHESRLIIRSYLLYAILTIFIGMRSGIIYNTVFIICYCFYRNYTDKGKCIWISKKIIFILAISVPFVLSFLFMYGSIRANGKIEHDSIGESLIDFFVNIGASSKVIKFGYEYRDIIPKWNFYSLGETLNYFKYGKLFNLFNSSDIPSRHSTEFALHSHAFGELISYLSMKNQFLSGRGTGSSFVAELFADFGYVGVAFGSMIYGWLFKKMSHIDGKHWISTAIKLFVFFTMLSAPRASFDGFIAAILNINNLLLVFGIGLLAQSFRRKEINEL